MFDIGFTELLVCMVVALVVIGPEQLPGTVRTVGLWIGRLKRSLRDTRQEIERQIGADDIRRQLHNEEVMQNLEEARLRIEQTMRESEAAITAAPASSPAPSAKDYGPPDELPNHAHEAEQTVQPSTSTTNTTANNTTNNNSTNANTSAQSGTGH